jgi:hypothetical protein
MIPHPAPPAKLINTTTRVNPLAFGVIDLCCSRKSDELEYIYRWNYSELIKEWVTQLAKLKKDNCHVCTE